jgi:hypothetical protein
MARDFSHHMAAVAGLAHKYSLNFIPSPTGKSIFRSFRKLSDLFCALSRVLAAAAVDKRRGDLTHRRPMRHKLLPFRAFPGQSTLSLLIDLNVLALVLDIFWPAIPTPEQTPNPKLARTSTTLRLNGDSNRENVAPFNINIFDPPSPSSPRAARALRRSSTTDMSTPSRSRNSMSHHLSLHALTCPSST